jgi:hypothetical protein
MAPLRSDVDCNRDGLLYNPDGSQVIIRPLNESRDQVVTCDLNVSSSGCSFLVSATGSKKIQILGNPTTTDTFISIKPNNASDWFPLTVNTSSDFNVSIPIQSGNWTPLYNISTIDVSDCTDPDPPYDPLPPGYTCNNNLSQAWYKPLDSINVTNIAPVMFYHFDADLIINDTELTPVDCTTTMPSNWSCVAFGEAKYLNERIGTMSGNIFIPYALDCVSPTGAPLRSVCRTNRLYLLSLLSLTLTPFVTEGGISPIPCFISRPDDFDCQSNETAIASNGTLPAVPLIHAPNNTGPINTSLPCLINDATAMPPCRRIEILYNFGLNASIVVEGPSVRLYLDGERHSLKCISPAFESADAPNSTLSRVQDYYGNFGGTSNFILSLFFNFPEEGENFIHHRHSQTRTQC